MGLYINYNSKENQLPAKGKTAALIADGAEKISGDEFCEDMVCVVENPFFDAALYCPQDEFDYVKQNPDPRKKTWLKYPNASTLAK